MSSLRVQRQTYTAESTQGSLLIDGAFEAFTLEPRRDQSQGKPYCVPEGVYDYIIGPSQHFGFDVIKVQNVEGFEAIEVHPGNLPADTHGCCLVGSTEAANFVGNSREEFARLLSKITPQGQIQYIDRLN